VTQQAIRLKVVGYLQKKLGTQKQCAGVFELTERSVNRIWSRYRKEGKRSLSNKKRGVQRDSKKINGQQAVEVRKLIKDKLPDQLKLPFGLWTRAAVQQLIEDRYGVKLSRWQVARYLKDWGYTPQKPIRKAFEQKPEQVKQWLKKAYPAIKKLAKKKKGLSVLEMKRVCEVITRQAAAMPQKVRHR
jgi:transposase